jgi:ribosomal protein S18 acetylase RimI-like enzyme
MPAHFLEGLSAQAFADSWAARMAAPPPRMGFFVGLGAAASVAAFAVAGPARDERLGADGEVWAINVLPTEQRRKLGAELMLECARALEATRFASVGLWVVEANARARRFYESLAGKPANSVEHDFGGRLVREIAYLWVSPLELERAAMAVMGRKSV